MKQRVVKNRIIAASVLLSSLFVVLPGLSQEESPGLTREEIRQVIDSAAQFMTDKYVFPEIGEQIADHLRTKHEKGKYQSFEDPRKFAEQLTKDLRSVNNDRHLGLRYDPEGIALYMKSQEDTANKDFEEAERRNNAFRNYGFKELKILPGNVGYLDLEYFSATRHAGPTAVAAMNYFANTDALIIDLRTNGGGSPEMIQLLSTYFFIEPQHLNSFYYREKDRTKQFWTLSHVPGQKMPDTEIYILTSNRTFSAAEEFTYNLKNLKRATIVGETTGGGAHPVSPHLINENYLIRIPFGRAVNPVTQTNWEGTGIEPHIKVPADQALDKAHVSALEHLIKTEEDEEYRSIYKWYIEGKQAQLNPVKLDHKTMELYAGKYGPRKIRIKDGVLFYQRERNPEMKMIPIKVDYFMFDDIDYFRLKVILEDGKAIAVEGHYDNGNFDRNQRSD